VSTSNKNVQQALNFLHLPEPLNVVCRVAVIVVVAIIRDASPNIFTVHEQMKLKQKTREIMTNPFEIFMQFFVVVVL
jgi:hypothetical protein